MKSFFALIVFLVSVVASSAAVGFPQGIITSSTSDLGGILNVSGTLKGNVVASSGTATTITGTIAGSQVAGNAIVQSGSYSNPTWLSLTSSKISDFYSALLTGTALKITGTIAASQVTGTAATVSQVAANQLVITSTSDPLIAAGGAYITRIIPPQTIVFSPSLLGSGTTISGSGVWVDGLTTTTAVKSFSANADIGFPDLVGSTNTINVSGTYGSISLPKLKYAYNGLSFTTNSNFTTLSFPELLYANQLNITPTYLTQINMPKLFFMGGQGSLGFPGNSTLPALQSFTLPELVIGAFYGMVANSMTTFSIPKLKYSYPLNITANALTAFSAPAFEVSDGVITLSGTSLTSISIPNLVYAGGACTFTAVSCTSATIGTVGTTKVINGNVTFTNAKLNQASVDGILAVLASLDGTNNTTSWGTGKTVNLSGGTSSTPSASGSTSKATIVARGGTVTTN